MSKPSTTVTWSTDTNYASGPESGQSTRLEPASGVKAQGWVPTEELPARWMNWLLGRLGEWTVYLNGITTDPDFVDADFDWGGEHTFNGPADFVVPPTFPAGFTAAGFVATPGDIGLGGTTNETLYTDGVGVPALRARQELVVLEHGQNSGNVGGTYTAVLSATAGASYWYWPTTSGSVSFPLKMPRGATVGNVRVGCSNQSGGTAAMSCELNLKAADKTTPSSTLGSGIGSGGGAVSLPTLTDHIFTIAVPAGVFTVDNSTNEYRLTVTGQVGCRIHWVELNYLDPGPRNG